MICLKITSSLPLSSMEITNRWKQQFLIFWKHDAQCAHNFAALYPLNSINPLTYNFYSPSSCWFLTFVIIENTGIEKIMTQKIVLFLWESITEVMTSLSTHYWYLTHHKMVLGFLLIPFWILLPCIVIFAVNTSQMVKKLHSSSPPILLSPLLKTKRTTLLDFKSTRWFSQDCPFAYFAT